MKQRHIGTSYLQVSVVGLGGTSFGERIDLAQTRAIVGKALDVGITFFDTSDVYGLGKSEEYLGEALGQRRKDVVVATKFGMPLEPGGHRDTSRAYILKAVEASLRRLKTDWIDLYQLHRPDGVTPIDETLGALDDLVTQGKIRYAGVSNLPSWQVVEAVLTAKHRGLRAIVSCQDEYNLAVRRAEIELIPAMRSYGLGLLPYYPIAGGLLTGKYLAKDGMPADTKLSAAPKLAERYLNEEKLAMAAELQTFSAERGHTLLELAFSWLAAQPVVASVIAGASKPEQVAQNASAADWDLTEDDLKKVHRMTRADLMVGMPWGGHTAHQPP